MNILLIGCGKMGSAMMAGWIMDPAIARIDVVSPHASSLPHHDKVRPFDMLSVWSGQVDVAVIAVKPQILDQVCVGLKNHIPDELPILSVAAGKTLARLASLLGDKHPIVRAMPNTPGAIQQGITGYCKNHIVNQKQHDEMISLISKLGKVIQVTDDSGIDAVSAISGSGPAYFYLFTELLERIAIKSGLPLEDAKILAQQTLIGSAALLDHTKEDPADLRAAVTSPGGTTAAAIKVFEENHALEKLMDEALQAARDRARLLN